MLVDLINKFLAEEGRTLEKSISYEVGLLAQWSFERQFLTEDEAVSKGKIRLSAAGKCPRQLAYGFHGFEKNGKELDARAKFTFFAGDLVEIAILQVAKAALKKYGGGSLVATGRDQISLKLQVNGWEIDGHPDGLFLSNKNTFLIECKSFSSFSFARFEKGQIDDSYIAQVNSYMEALGLTQCIFIGYNKDSNVLHEIIIDKTEAVVEKVRDNIKTVFHSTPENLPEQPEEYGPDEKGLYDWHCLYCAYWKTCRPTAEKVLVKNSYKLKESTWNKTTVPN